MSFWPAVMALLPPCCVKPGLAAESQRRAANERPIIRIAKISEKTSKAAPGDERDNPYHDGLLALVSAHIFQRVI